MREREEASDRCAESAAGRVGQTGRRAEEAYGLGRGHLLLDTRAVPRPGSGQGRGPGRQIRETDEDTQGGTVVTFEETLSYDDVLLVPGFADFLPGQAKVTTQLTKKIPLNIPILAAAMDTVSEDRLAIALALEGGAAVIHRNLTPQAQAEHVG